MPSCVNCAPGSTPVAYRAVSPISATGSGTPSDPIVIGLVEGASSFAFTVQDSPTINFTLYGTGSDEDPYVLTADTGSATKLTGLADVDSDPPTDGQTVVWVGPSTTGHWEFQSPGEVSIDTFDAADLIGTLNNDRLSGVLKTIVPVVNADWNSLQSPGMYRVQSAGTNTNAPVGYYTYGTLLVFASGNSVTQLYFEHSATPATPTFTQNNLWWRTKYNASDWTFWGTPGRVDTNLILTGTDAFQVSAGFSLVEAHIARSGNIVTWQATVTASSSLSNAAALNGDVIPGFQIGTVPGAHVPAGAGYGHIATTGQGMAFTGFVNNAGGTIISTMPSGIVASAGTPITAAAGYPIQVGGTWVAKELVS